MAFCPKEWTSTPARLLKISRDLTDRFRIKGKIAFLIEGFGRGAIAAGRSSTQEGDVVKGGNAKGSERCTKREVKVYVS
jgi:hypothetical protein